MKLHLLDLGTVEFDLAFSVSGAGVSTRSEPNPTSPRKLAAVIGALVEHPKVGPILYDTGFQPDASDTLPAPLTELFAIQRQTALPEALAAAGYELGDIRAVVISHLHLDHGGGLQYFRGTDVPIYVHAAELRHAFYVVATKEDLGVYLPSYLDLALNWQALDGDRPEPFDDFRLQLLPGHAPGLLGLRLDLANAGPFYLTSDQFHLRANWEPPTPLGWLLRDHTAWWQSYRAVKNVADRTGATLVFGHDREVLEELRREPFYD